MVDYKPLSSDANTQAVSTYLEFKISLLDIANKLAIRDRANEIQSSHIDEARRLLAPNKDGDRHRELAKYVGGACFGAALPGLYQVIRAASTTPPLDAPSLVFYILLGFAAVGLTVYGYGD